MKFKNYELESLAKFFYELELSGKSSRMRSRFLKLLEDYLKNIYSTERISIIEQFALRDEKGEILLNEDKTEVVLQPEKRKQCIKELEELAHEDFIIETTETNKDMLITVGETLLNCEVKLTGQQATLYYYWCEEFESAIAHYENKED